MESLFPGTRTALTTRPTNFNDTWAEIEKGSTQGKFEQLGSATFHQNVRFYILFLLILSDVRYYFLSASRYFSRRRK